MDERPEGSFLLRDSAQDEYLFSVSFRRYGRSLHARIEEQGHRFSFDCHDPGVFMSRNIPQLLDHYKVSQVTLTELLSGQSVFGFSPKILIFRKRRRNAFWMRIL